MKIAIVSHTLPPRWSGQAVILYRLLRDLDAEKYCLISHETVDGPSQEKNASRRLPARHYHVPQFQLKPGRPYRLAKWRDRLSIIIAILVRGVQIARIVRRERCSAVVACTGNLVDVPAGFVASRLTRVAFYPYMFDYYSEQWTTSMRRAAARRLEPFVVRGATRVIVPNEFLGDALRRRYGAETAVVRNACDIPEDGGALDGDRPPPSETRIVYTGAVYDANAHAFRNLVTALGLLEQMRTKVHVYTAQSLDELAAEGIEGPVVWHEHEPQRNILRIQREAYVLFLPLGLDSPYPEIIRTSAPGKMGEYLASRRPILVHAPRDSYVAWYFRRHGCGLVVDADDPGQLARAIERLLTDGDVREELVTRAWERACADYRVALAQSAFAAAVGLDQGSGREAGRAASLSAGLG